MKNLKIFFSTVLLLALMSACVSNEQQVDYENSVVTPSLEIPPDLITRSQEKSPSQSQ